MYLQLSKVTVSPISSKKIKNWSVRHSSQTPTGIVGPLVHLLAKQTFTVRKKLQKM
jgi:hypothetical protein